VSISQEELFRIALGLEKPWYIKTIDFKVEEKQLDLHIDFDSGSKFPCPSCDRPGCHVHDTIERTWRHLNFFHSKPTCIAVFHAQNARIAELNKSKFPGQEKAADSLF
jgi:transposase